MLTTQPYDNTGGYSQHHPGHFSAMLPQQRATVMSILADNLVLVAERLRTINGSYEETPDFFLDLVQAVDKALASTERTLATQPLQVSSNFGDTGMTRRGRRNSRRTDPHLQERSRHRTRTSRPRSTMSETRTAAPAHSHYRSTPALYTSYPEMSTAITANVPTAFFPTPDLSNQASGSRPPRSTRSQYS